MEAINQIASIVHDNIRLAVQGHVDIGIVFLHGAAMMGKYGNALLYQGCTYIVLGGKRIGGCSNNLSPGCLQYQCQICGLGLQMHGHNHTLAGKWLADGILLLNSIHNWHKILHPVDLVMAAWCQGNILNL